MQRWQRRTAVLAATLAVLGATAFVLLRVRGLSPGYVELRTFTDDASGLMDGTQVRLNGLSIGYLENQKLTNSLDKMRKVELDLKVKAEYLKQIPADSLVGLASDNLLGDLYIGIHRGKSPQPVAPGGELRSTQAQDISKMMARMGQELDRLNEISDRVNKLLDAVNAGQGTIGKLLSNSKVKQGAVAAEFDALMNDIQHGHGTLTKLLYDDPLMRQTQSPMKRLDEIMATAGNTTKQMKELTDGLAGVTQEFHTLQADIAAGKGSMGKLDVLQKRFDELTVKWNAMLDRMNSGQGTAGQLLVNPQLNQAIDAMSRDVQELANGLKTNPKKFITIRIF